MMLKPGTYLQERYEILSLIGTGGMSEVYQARCHKLNRLVAIKVLKEEYSQDSNFVSKFKMEAQAAAGLSHPNIVSVYDVVDESDLHFIVMELIEGITLKSYILKKGHLGVKETIGIAIQVAQGIAAAHDQHIVHRDIKPQNMIISRDGKVKVADFGIARAVSSQTIGSTAVGSVHYISPEQARGSYSDARSDLYSLGITMYEMVTGTLPFDGDNTVTIALAHLEDPVMPPSHSNPEVTASLDRIILKCTAKRPERRYQDAYELIADLRHALVDPNDDFLKKEPELDESSPTMIRKKGDPELIRDPQKKNPAVQEEDWDIKVLDPVRREDTRRREEPIRKEDPSEWEDEESFEEPTRKKRGGNGKKKKERPDDVNPQMERLLTGIGVAAAILIVAVVIVIFAKLGGIFNLGSGSIRKNTETPAIEAEESLASTECRVPALKGLSEEAAKAALDEVSLKIHYEYAESGDEDEGKVIEQSAAEGTVVSKFSEITVTIGEGSGKLDLTDMGLEQQTGEAAKAILEAHKLKVTLTEENSDTIEKGKVLRYEPEKAAPGELVMLYVSSGPQVPSVPMPEIEGMSEENARIVMEAIGLELGERKEEKSAEVAKGIIIKQDIAAKEQTPEGTAVGYTVSTGKGTKYVAAVNDDFQLRDLFGPSSGDTQIEVSIVMKQVVNGEVVTKVVLEPRQMGGDITIPVHYNIEGADGVLTGELQVLDLTNDKVLKTYPLEFLEVDR